MDCHAIQSRPYSHCPDSLDEEWSGDADPAMVAARVLLLLILMMKIIDHWHIPDEAFLISGYIHEGAHPVSDVMLPKSRHPQFGFVRMSCEGTRRTVWRLVWRRALQK